jgi:hypothetical protein
MGNMLPYVHEVLYTLINKSLKYKKQNGVDFKGLIQCYFCVNQINA